MSMAARRYCSHCNAAFASDIDKCPRDGADLRMRSTNPLLGQTLGGRYRLVERLGAGGMGEVYRAEHITIGKSFAIKVLLGEVAADNSMVARFHREAQALSRLSHRNIVSVADFGETDQGLLYLVTEYIDGTPLSEAVRDSSFGVERTIHVVKQIAKALSHAHRRGLVHRDLKPDNIMLVQTDDEADVVKVLDFGLARVAETEAKESENRLTTQGIVMGTPAYISPEQALGTLADHRADLYSLGVVLYELLVGTVPFEGKNPIDLMSQHLRTPPPDITRHGVTGEFKALTMRLLEKDPNNRYQDADSFLSELEGLAEYPAGGPRPRSTPNAAVWADADTVDSAADTIDHEPMSMAKSDTLAASTTDLDGIAEAAVAQAISPEIAPAERADDRHSGDRARTLGIVIGLIGAGALAALGVMYLSRGGDENTANDEKPVAVVAEVLADAEPVAAPVVASASDAGATVEVVPPEPLPPKPDPPEPKPTSKKKPAPTKAALETSIVRIGKSLDRLAKMSDKGTIAGLRNRYFDLATSIGDLDDRPDARRKFAAKIRRLQSDVRKAGVKK